MHIQAMPMAYSTPPQRFSGLSDEGKAAAAANRTNAAMAGTREDLYRIIDYYCEGPYNKGHYAFETNHHHNWSPANAVLSRLFIVDWPAPTTSKQEVYDREFLQNAANSGRHQLNTPIATSEDVFKVLAYTARKGYYLRKSHYGIQAKTMALKLLKGIVAEGFSYNQESLQRGLRENLTPEAAKWLVDYLHYPNTPTLPRDIEQVILDAAAGRG